GLPTLGCAPSGAAPPGLAPPMGGAAPGGGPRRRTPPAMSKVPPRAPARPPVWDPHDERYWDPRDLEQELRRTFQICHECRMCVTYCGSLPLLFDDIDAEIGADRAEGAETVGAETFANVSDHCWQCKLCYIKC